MLTDMRHAVCEVMPDAEAVALHMAELFIETIATRLKKAPGNARIALSGGSTPKRLFELLARPEMARRIDWSRVELFYGDERHVPEGHKDSNHTTAEHYLLSKVPVNKDLVHAVPTAGSVVDDARFYQDVLQKSYGSTVLEAGRPLFDLVMLGMGPDGHTASLFPGQPVLKEKAAWVSVAEPETVPYKRITLTYPALASSHLIVFLITGEGKVPMLRRLRAGDESIPAGCITSEGRILILADKAAVGGA